MKKQAVLTAVASLLTFASVAVVPAFAQDTGGRTYNPMPQGEYSSSRGDHERHQGKGDWRGQGGYGYSRYDYGSYSKEMPGKDTSSKERPKSYGHYGSGNSGSNYGYGYGNYSKDTHRMSR